MRGRHKEKNDPIKKKNPLFFLGWRVFRWIPENRTGKRNSVFPKIHHNFSHAATTGKQKWKKKNYKKNENSFHFSDIFF